MVSDFKERYSDKGEIGSGAMGSISKATDRTLNRTVAMKTLRSSLQDKMQHRFEREAMVLARLEHPNIIPIHDFGRRPDGSVFYTMKLVSGTTLHEIIRGLRQNDQQTHEQYDLNDLVQIFRKICDAMAFAHEQGVIHRDLKPENVMVGAFGEVLVMDWGLAKISDEFQASSEFVEIPREVTQILEGDGTLTASAFHVLQGSGTQPNSEASDSSLENTKLDEDNALEKNNGESNESPDVLDAQQTELGDIVDSTELTGFGTVMGTPGYMPPEQAKGDVNRHDQRSDVYALGAILYSLLTLRVSVGKSKLPVLLRRILQGEINPPVIFNDSKVNKADGSDSEISLSHCPGGIIPPALSAVTMRCLATEPEDRYADVGELIADIDAWQSGFATSVEKISTLGHFRLLMERHRVLSASTAIVVLLCVVFIINLQSALLDAQVERDKAQKAKRQADASRKQETLAKEIAEDQRDKAEEQKKLADDARANTETANELQKVALLDANLALADAAWMDRNPESMKRYMSKVDVMLKAQRSDELQRSTFRYLQGKLTDGMVKLDYNLGFGVKYWPGNESYPPAFVGHENDTNSMSRFSELVFFDCSTGEAYKRFQANGLVFALSPVGDHLAVGERNIRIYDIETGEVELKIPLAPGRLLGLEFSSDGQFLFVKHHAQSRDFYLYDMQGNQQWKLNGRALKGSAGLGQFALGPRNRYAAVHYMTPQQEVWLADFKTGERVRRMDVGNSFLWQIRFNRNGTLLAGVDFQVYATVWDTETGTIRHRLRAAIGEMRHLAFTDQNHLITFTEDSRKTTSFRRIQIWEMREGTEIESRIGLPFNTAYLAVNPKDSSIFCGGQPATLWRPPLVPPDFQIASSIPGEICFLRDDFLICPSNDSTRRDMALYNLNDTELQPVWRDRCTQANAKISGNRGRETLSIITERPRSYDVLGFTEGANQPQLLDSRQLEYSPHDFDYADIDDSLFVVDSERNQRNQVYLIGAEAKQPKAKFLGPNGTVCHKLGVINSRACLLLFRSEQAIDVPDKLYNWEVGDANQAEPDKVNAEEADAIEFDTTIHGLAVSSDGKQFAVAGQNALISIYDVESFELIRKFRAHDGAIMELAFHPTLPIIASCSEDLSIKVWNSETGAHLKTYLGPSRTVRRIAFNASGTRIACNSDDKVTRVWNFDGQKFLDASKPVD